VISSGGLPLRAFQPQPRGPPLASCSDQPGAAGASQRENCIAPFMRGGCAAATQVGAEAPNQGGICRRGSLPASGLQKNRGIGRCGEPTRCFRIVQQQGRSGPPRRGIVGNHRREQGAVGNEMQTGWRGNKILCPPDRARPRGHGGPHTRCASGIRIKTRKHAMTVVFQAVRPVKGLAQQGGAPPAKQPPTRPTIS